MTGMVVAIAYFVSRPDELALVATFLASLGILFSFVWAILLHRTNDALALWREAAARLEELQPPFDASLEAPITLRSGATIRVDLLRPYGAHRYRFSRSEVIGWTDRLNPSRLTEFLPLAFLSIWIVVLVYAWTWYLLQ